ncbi:uncharacterized protein LOC120332710 isoform X2 [Styela clava]
MVRLPQVDEEQDLEVRKSLENKLSYELDVAPAKNKVQCLLSFGEYSLFKKWKVLAEGDFIPFKPGPDTACQTYYEDKLAKKRRKVALRDVRTLAITKNWLIMARLYRLYQVERDAVVPGGIPLELRRLVPLRYLRVCVARPAARVIGIANQSGVLKQYQMLDKPSPTDGDPFMMWRRAIGQLRPNLNDEVLYLTLNTFERWKRQHACRLTIYPGYQSQSGISLNDWQVKLGEKEPEQCRCDKTPAPPPKKETPPPKSDSSSSIEYVTGRQVSIGDSEERPLTDDEGSQEIEGIVKKFGGSSKMSEIMEAPLGPSPLKPAASSSTNGSGSYSGTALLSVDMPPPSAGRRRKSLKTIFRLGFLTTKSKQRTKSKSDDGMPSPDTGPAQPPGRRVVQRRMSRLEMNEPIEDIFSEVKFETIQKRPSTSNSAGNDVSEDDDDIIEDPEVIMRSIMSKKIVANEDDDIFFEGVVKPGIDVNGDVTNPELLEKDLLLPESERNRPPLAPVSEEISIKISDEDSR